VASAVLRPRAVCRPSVVTPCNYSRAATPALCQRHVAGDAEAEPEDLAASIWRKRPAPPVGHPVARTPTGRPLPTRVLLERKYSGPVVRISDKPTISNVPNGTTAVVYHPDSPSNTQHAQHSKALSFCAAVGPPSRALDRLHARTHARTHDTLSGSHARKLPRQAWPRLHGCAGAVWRLP
jgi:hypothetical protein